MSIAMANAGCLITGMPSDVKAAGRRLELDPEGKEELTREEKKWCSRAEREKRRKMIKAVMVMNTQGKPRVTKFYDFYPPEKQQDLIRSVHRLLSSRAENVSNFMDADSIFGLDTHLVYKHFATLYFVFIFDSSENELAMLDLIQVFVETLDKCFKNVCELDIVYNYSKVHTILDEIIFGGQVLETSSSEVVKAVDEMSKLESTSNAISLVTKSVAAWRSR